MVNILTIVKNIFLKLKQFFTFFFGLETPKSRIFTITLSSLILIILPFNKLHLLPTFSVYEKVGLYDFLGFEFYSSGITRSLSSIFHLQIQDAWNYNPLGFIFIIILLYIFILDIKKIIEEKNKKINILR
jgi:hypothetical protein